MSLESFFMDTAGSFLHFMAVVFPWVSDWDSEKGENVFCLTAVTEPFRSLAAPSEKENASLLPSGMEPH